MCTLYAGYLALKYTAMTMTTRHNAVAAGAMEEGVSVRYIDMRPLLGCCHPHHRLLASSAKRTVIYCLALN